jgi:hypothetical protein
MEILGGGIIFSLFSFALIILACFLMAFLYTLKGWPYIVNAISYLLAFGGIHNCLPKSVQLSIWQNIGIVVAGIAIISILLYAGASHYATMVPFIILSTESVLIIIAMIYSPVYNTPGKMWIVMFAAGAVTVLLTLRHHRYEICSPANSILVFVNWFYDSKQNFCKEELSSGLLESPVRIAIQ